MNTLDVLVPVLSAIAGLGAWLVSQLLGIRRDMGAGHARIHERIDALDRTIARVEGERTSEREALAASMRETAAGLDREALRQHQEWCPALRDRDDNGGPTHEPVVSMPVPPLAPR